jgi:hypothetical protein
MRLLLTLTAGFLFGCSSIKAKVENSPPEGGLSGNKIAVFVTSEVEAKDSTTAPDDIVTASTKKWLSDSGYSLVEKSSEANAVVLINVFQADHRQYSHKFLVKRSLRTGSRMAFDQGRKIKNSTERGLELTLISQKYGDAPVVVSSGSAGPDKEDDDFFESKSALSSAVAKMLEGSVLATPSRQVAAVSGQNPGCWVHFGLTYDIDSTTIPFITSFETGSAALASALKPGDYVRAIDDEPAIQRRPENSANAAHKFWASRGKQDLEVKLSPAMICTDMRVDHGNVIGKQVF